MIRRTTSSSGSPTARRSIRSSADSSANRSSASARVRRVAGRVERVAERGDLGGVDAVGDPDQLVAEGLGLPRPAARQEGRPAAEQAEVAGADRPPGAGEQGQQGGVGGDVVEQVQGGHDLGHLGQPDQPGQADDLDRHVASGQGVEHVGGVRVVAGEHADVGPLRPGVVGRLDLVGQPGRARRPGSSSTRIATSPCPASGFGGQPDDLAGVPVVERLGQPVGHLEDAAVGAAADGQRERPVLAGAATGTCRRSARMLDTDAPRQP